MMQNNRQFMSNSMGQNVPGYAAATEYPSGSCALMNYGGGLQPAHHGAYNLNLRLRPHDFSLNNLSL